MTIMHIDANSAYLSWTAVHMLEKGYPIDIRDIPSCIAGDPKNRHGIILAKSGPAKKYKIQTGESLMEARKRCPELAVYPPNYDLFLLCSNAMYEILREYSPLVQRYSIDECFLDYRAMGRNAKNPVDVAFEIKNRIHDELGFTVNVGVSNNKLLAKMAGELRKPNVVETIWPDEVPAKLWPLPVGDLFMVGRATTKKLLAMNIRTVGDLANADPNMLKVLLKNVHGQLVWEYANGLDLTPVTTNSDIFQKSVGNSITIPYDVSTEKEARQVLLALCERVGMRLRKLGCKASLVSVHLRTSEFTGRGHQIQLSYHTDSTSDIYRVGWQLVEESWRHEPLRQMGISAGNFAPVDQEQISLFHPKDLEKDEQMNRAVDRIRSRYGDRSIIRGAFANTNVNAIQGGVNDGDFLMMGGYSL